MRLRTVFLLLALLAVLTSPVLYLVGGSQNPLPQADANAAKIRERPQPPSLRSAVAAVPIVAATVERRDVPEYLFGIGTVQAFKTVTVRSRVDGQLLSLNFNEGQQVRAGDVIAQLDPQPFQANVHQMEANVRRDQAQLQGVEAQLARLSSLAVRDFASRSSIDNQRAQVAQSRAAIEADMAQLDAARIQLEYVTIRSPLTGRAGLRLVDEGNLIRAGDPAGIFVVTQVQPISVVFTLPEDELPAVNRKLASGTPPEVTAFGRDGQKVLAEGTLSSIDNLIDRKSGTFKLKARFENEKNTLWPGQFVNVRLQIGTRHEGIVVPEASLQRGPDGTYVYIVEANDTVTMRTVKFGGAQNGMMLVDSGLRAGERVVIDGQFRLKPGSVVTEVTLESPSQPGRPPTNVRERTKL